MDDNDEGYYYTGQTPFRKPNESKFRFHARRLISIQTLGRLEYTVEEAETKFNRALGPVELTFVGLGAVIGTGVFVLMGTAASSQAGPSVTISFILGGFVSGIAALSYAEMASMIPIAGSAYTYAYASIGELAAWIIGWDLILEYLVGAATVSVGWSSYMVAFFQDAFHVTLAKQWVNAPITWDGGNFSYTGDYFNAPAFFISVVVSTTIYFGIHLTARINNFLVIFKVIALVIVIFAMVPFVKTENYHPYIPPLNANGEFGVSGMLAGASTVFFAYIGFDSISTTAQEAKDPQVNLPIGIMATIVTSSILYVGISVVTVGVLNYSNLSGSSPVTDAARQTGMLWLVVLTELGALAATTSVILVLLISQPRVFYAMANDGLIPRFFAKVHPKYKTPYVGTLVSGVICAICGGLLPISVLSDISSVGTIFAYFVVNIGVIILRYTRKTVPRRFKVPGGPFIVPGIGAASSLLLLQGAKREAIIRLLVWMAVGLLVYILYGRTHSEINNPRITMDEPMQVLHENFSVDTVNYQGYTDDDLRQQYARQLARRMGYDYPLTQRQSAYLEDRMTHDFSDATQAGDGYGFGHERPSQGDDCTSSQGGIDSGHGVGVPFEVHTKQKRDSSSTASLRSGPKTPSSSSSARSFHQLQPPVAAAHYPESAYISPRAPPC
ncbi:basic amino acid/polyamine antiporter, APA family [Entomortierella parvispora]|uniref:Basic amino acid/polyamine antiporter, APA family n=1 Tax=Entomortierella parvispora TaxID=205924 RepID=A0A9P3LZL4_9FUNG|nr:basic amino acid/polyamine antiporter, APA family [Entomortierella parvispora]